jgi:hypothetical protein
MGWPVSPTTSSSSSRGAVEWARPHSEGALIRADQQREQPRRGRQGVLLLYRQHPDALVHEVSLQYPQREYPYRDLLETNRHRSREEFEYELLDAGIFDDDRYFDVFVEYAKADPENVLIKVWVHNRGSEAAQIHVLPTLRFRNTWSAEEGAPKPLIQANKGAIQASHPQLGEYTLECEAAAEALFTEDETTANRLWGQPNPSPSVKDAFHAYVIAGKREAVNPAGAGTKAAAHFVLDVPAGGQLEGTNLDACN